MGYVVAKFGGSSLADASQFRKVKAIIDADPNRVFVVPSAPGRRYYTDDKITDLLYLVQQKVTANELIGEIFDRIIERYVDIAFELDLKIDILSQLTIVRDNILAGASADYAASRGEYLNALLLAEYLKFDFIDATDVICFDEKGKFDSEKTQEICSKRLKKYSHAVIPGFYGAIPDGKIKTFSRGGSDISGAIIARACMADLYENWTDVSGMLMADPRVVPNPAAIKTITYTELRELAYMGAAVLHDESIFPVRQACIPINVRNTNAIADAGTMIVPEAADYTDLTITGIAGRKGFTIIALEKDKMNAEVGFAYKVLKVLADHGVSMEHMPSGIDTLSVVIADTQLHEKRQQVVDDLVRICEPDSLEIQDSMALIAVVGRGMINKVGTSAKVFSALAKSGVNVRMIDQGSSEINIIIGVENHEFNTAVNAIYRAFVDDMQS